MSRSRLNSIYHLMKARCCNSSNPNYKNYGARGITVCEEWKNNFKAFKTWALNNGYSDSLTIDRIDNNKGYCPENCRWVSMKEQCNNYRHNHLITYKGKTMTMAQWAEEEGIPYYRLRARLNYYKDDMSKVFAKKDLHAKNITYKNETKRLSDWCKELKLNYKKTQRRLDLGWSVERAFEE